MKIASLESLRMLKQGKLKIRANSIDGERRAMSFNFRLLPSFNQFPFKSL